MIIEADLNNFEQAWPMPDGPLVGRQRDIIDQFNADLFDPTKEGFKIAFIGDSYCADIYHVKGKDWARPPYFDTWVDIVAKEFNAKILQVGFSGLSFINSYYQAIRPHKKHPVVVLDADWVIVCVSAPDRLPNRFGLPMTPTRFSFWNTVRNNNLVKNDIPDGYLNTKRRFEKATDSYYNNIYFSPFHKYAQFGALIELDNFILEHKKNVIWIPCFEDSMCGFVPKSGVVADAPLHEFYFKRLAKRLDLEQITMDEIRDSTKLTKLVNNINKTEFKNHFDGQSNSRLGQVIINYIKNNRTHQHPASRITLSTI
tara:strand:- start:132 stop:1070 length:939 start_codon:yes stop_codon:yes gene_type:complete